MSCWVKWSYILVNYEYFWWTHRRPCLASRWKLHNRRWDNILRNNVGELIKVFHRVTAVFSDTDTNQQRNQKWGGSTSRLRGARWSTTKAPGHNKPRPTEEERIPRHWNKTCGGDQRGKQHQQNRENDKNQSQVCENSQVEAEETWRARRQFQKVQEGEKETSRSLRSFRENGNWAESWKNCSFSTGRCWWGDTKPCSEEIQEAGKKELTFVQEARKHLHLVWT